MQARSDGGAMSRAEGLSRSAYRARMAESIELRSGTDEIIAGWYRFIPAVAVAFGLLTLAVLVYVAGTFAGVVLGLFFMFCVGFAIVAVLNYKFVKRYGTHLGREAALRASIVGFLRTEAERSGSAGLIDQELSAMERLDSEALALEKVPNPLFTPFAAIPLVGFVAEYYALRVVTGPPAEHEQRWREFLRLTALASGRLGLALELPAAEPMPRRPFAAYLLLSLALFPFLIYWYHVLTKDMNAHFQGQWGQEDALLSALR